MNRRGAGVAFCVLAGVLYAMRYIAAAIFGSGISSWSQELFNAMYDYVGPGLTTFSIVSLVAGILYLLASEWETIKKKAGDLNEDF